MTEWLLVLLSLGLVLACGTFVAAEFSFVTVDRPTVDRAAAGGDRQAKGVLQALRTLSTQLSSAQLGITVTNLAIGFFTEPAIAQLLRGPLTAAGVPEAGVVGVSLTIALIIATAVTMVYGELVPKNLAIARPLWTARMVQGFQRGFTVGTGPLVRVLNGTANRILLAMRVEPQEELASARSPEELTSLVRRSAEKGALPRETATLLVRSLTFGDKRVADVITPRVRMVTVPASATVADVIATARRSGHSRFPVVDANLDDVVGMVHVKHAVKVAAEARAATAVTEVMVEPMVVPATLELDNLLEGLRGGLQTAIVIDEFGGTEGLVTLEDLVEELVGDVVDEHDRHSADVRRNRDGSWVLSGLLRPDEVSELCGVVLPEHADYDTLGGLVTSTLGRMPEVGDTCTAPGVTLTVERMDGFRVDRVRLEAVDGPATTATAGPEDETAGGGPDDQRTQRGQTNQRGGAR